VADVFLSYSSRHRDLTRNLAVAIEAEGYTVWWDQALESWGSYQKQIRAALDDARVVVVIWSEGARASDYVYAEAKRAYEDGKLVNACAPDFPLREIPEPMSVSHIDMVADRAGILATIASVWSGTPIKTRVPYHALFFGRCGRHLLDWKTLPLNRHLKEVNPSELLQAQYEVVPYVEITGRRQEVLDWCRCGRPTAGRLIHGPGGLGKTRLMIDVAATLRSDRWLAGFLESPRDNKEAALRLRKNALEQLVATGDEAGVLIVMDYAEGRQDEIDWLVNRLDARPRNATRPVRLVLLARSAGSWWQELHNRTDEVARVFRRSVDGAQADAEAVKRARQAARFGDAIGLEQIPAGDVRVDFFRASVAAFEPVVLKMGWRKRTDGPPNERRLRHYRDKAAFARPLALQMEALLYLAVAELDPDLIGVDAILDRILGLERRHWAKLIGALDERQEHELRRGVAQVTAVAGVRSRHAATGLLMLDRHYKREVPDHAWPVLAGLTRIYGTDKGNIFPLEPDLLGEHEVATTADERLIEACLDWIARLPTTGQPEIRKQLIAVLQRATHPEHGADRAGNAAALLDHLICSRASEIAAELIGVTIETPGKLGELLGARLDCLDDETLGSFDAALPLQSLALSDFSYRVAARRVRLAQDLTFTVRSVEAPEEGSGIAELDHLAARLSKLGMRLSDLGRHEEALAATQEAVDIRRRLFEIRPDAVLPELAGSLNNLGNRLSNLGLHEEALAASQEAVDIYWGLAETRPDAFLSDLASGLNNLGIRLSNLRRRKEALAASQEAVDIYRRLAETRPDAFLPDVASSLNNLGRALSNLGRREEALAGLQESVDIRRRFAETQPDAFLLDLAWSLNNISILLSDLGRRAEALAASQEAVDIKRRLAETRPDAFLPDLVISLGALAQALASAGRHRDAAAATFEGLTSIAAFVERRPRAFGDLARALRQDYLESCERSGAKPNSALVKRIARAVAATGRPKRTPLSRPKGKDRLRPKGR
jgi:tetratricopeptide (TPR) repeat protein